MKIKAFAPVVFMLAAACMPLSAAETERLTVSAIRYDQDYPEMDYSGPARANRVWRLQQKLDSGEVKLQWEPRFGYLRSLLKALDIDQSSQTLVFSKTSLQTANISEATPRALYYNDDTYVGYVQNSDLVEFTATDARAGVLFFGMVNRKDTPPRLEREGGRCLTCHDTYSMMGGGVPRVLVVSAPVDHPSDQRAYHSAIDVDDRTPIAQRWGGWYVSGWYLPSKQGVATTHFGNLPLRTETSADQGERLRALADTRDNRGNLQGYFDTTAYLSDKSDVVALLVLEHQAFVQNLITRTLFKSGRVLARDGRSVAATQRTWSALAATDQAALKVIMEPLLRALFFADAAPLPGEVVTSSGFTERFAQKGPHDSAGRSLRDLQLDGRLFRYPLSYMVYSESFNELPAFLLDYLDGRIVEVLQGRDTTGLAAHLDAQERAAISAILVDTLPRISRRLAAQ